MEDDFFDEELLDEDGGGFGFGEIGETIGNVVKAPVTLIKKAANTETGQMVILYGEKKYMHYKKDEDPVKFINENIKLTKILTAIHNAIKKKEANDPQSLEMDLNNDEWVVSFQQRLLSTLREDKGRTENQHRENLRRYVEFLVNKRAVYLCKCPDATKQGDLYYNSASKSLFLVNSQKIEFFMLYKNFPEKIFWLKENTKLAQEEFNKKQIKMYGPNAKDWNGKPIKQAEIKRTEEEMRRPGTAGGGKVETPKE